MTTTISAPAVSTLLPLELVDKAIGSRIHIIMKNDKEPDFKRKKCRLIKR